jgi:alpha-tubulin suppressor-like RCC1 family protein
LPALTLLGLLLLWIFVKDLIPTTVVKVHQTLAATSSGSHSAAVRSDGTVWTWGSNEYGQLGNGRRDDGHPEPELVMGLEGCVSVAAGARHTLALKKDGTIWSWGDNESCQLGDSSGIVGRAEPAQVAGLEGVSAIGAGELFSIALKKDGTLWYFGDSFVGGSTNGGIFHDFAKPRRIGGIRDVIAVSCGRRSVLALKKDGTVWNWGVNSDGQCGGKTVQILWEPVQVQGLDDAVAVAAGEHFSLALKKDGTVWGWGSLLVRPGKSLQHQYQPVQIEEVTGVTEIKAGNSFAVALKKNGTVWYSGADPNLPGEPRSAWEILKRSKLASTIAIFAGGEDAFLEKRDGTLLCWGPKNKQLTLASVKFKAKEEKIDVAASATAEEAQVSPSERYQAIAAGSDHSLALGVDGTVWAWGENEFGQLASSKVGSGNRPLQICEQGGAPLTQVVSIAAGAVYSMAVKSDGTVWIWGKGPAAVRQPASSRTGRNGVWEGAPVKPMLPTKVPGIQDASAVAGGYGGSSRFVVLHTDGTLSTLANFRFLTPMQVTPLPGATGIVAISAGATHFAALRSDGTVWTWGSNDAGQLGNGSTAPSDQPQQVRGIADVSAVAAGNNVTLVVKKDGTLWGWGKDVHGVLGEGLAVRSSLSPVRIPGVKDVVALAIPGQGYANGSHFLAVDSGGKLWSWGFNASGQLGQGTKGVEMLNTPKPVPGLDGVSSVAAGVSHSMALLSDGTIRSWGKNSSGQLGNSSGADSAFPVRVSGRPVNLGKTE